MQLLSTSFAWRRKTLNLLDGNYRTRGGHNLPSRKEKLQRKLSKFFKAGRITNSSFKLITISDIDALSLRYLYWNRTWLKRKNSFWLNRDWDWDSWANFSKNKFLFWNFEQAKEPGSKYWVFVHIGSGVMSLSFICFLLFMFLVLMECTKRLRLLDKLLFLVVLISDYCIIRLL